MTPEFSLTYSLFLLSVILTTLGLLFLGGIARSWRRRKRASFRKKLLFFPVFVVGIFAIGGLTGQLQEWLFTYLKRNVATSLTGLLAVIVIAWFLYDWVIWRRK